MSLGAAADLWRRAMQERKEMESRFEWAPHSEVPEVARQLHAAIEKEKSAYRQWRALAGTGNGGVGSR